LVKEEAVERSSKGMKKAYQDKTGIEAAIFQCQAAAGTHVVD